MGIGPLRVELESNERGVVARFDELFAAFGLPAADAPVVAVRVDATRPSPDDDHPTYDSSVDGDRLLSSSDLREHELSLTRVLNKRRLDAEPELLHVHSAAVARGGRAVMLIGRPGSGKSTLSAALLRADWQYVTDEQVVLQPGDGRLIPHPRPLTLRESSWAMFAGVLGIPTAPSPPPGGGRVEVPPQALGPLYCGGPLEASTVVFPRFLGGAAVLERVPSKAETVALLAACCFDLERLGAGGVETLVKLADRCGAWRLDFGDLGEAAHRVAEAFDEPAPAVGVAARHLPPVPLSRLPAGTLARAPQAHAWAFGDGSTVVYHPPTLTLARLDAAGTALWEALGEPCPAEELRRPQPAGAPAATRLVWLDILVGAGLLAVGGD